MNEDAMDPFVFVVARTKFTKALATVHAHKRGHTIIVYVRLSNLGPLTPIVQKGGNNVPLIMLTFSPLASPEHKPDCFVNAWAQTLCTGHGFLLMRGRVGPVHPRFGNCEGAGVFCLTCIILGAVATETHGCQTLTLRYIRF
jgi:hypothetical protein